MARKAKTAAEQQADEMFEHINAQYQSWTVRGGGQKPEDFPNDAAGEKAARAAARKRSRTSKGMVTVWRVPKGRGGLGVSEEYAFRDGEEIQVSDHYVG